MRPRARRRSCRLPLPPVLFGNVPELIRNKANELDACVRYLYEYREADLMVSTETWLTESDRGGGGGGLGHMLETNQPFGIQKIFFFYRS